VAGGVEGFAPGLANENAGRGAHRAGHQHRPPDFPVLVQQVWVAPRQSQGRAFAMDAEVRLLPVQVVVVCSFAETWTA
jgi:hypothetical protein